MFEALVEEAPAMTDFQVNLAKMSNNIGVVEKTLGHVQAAERSYREAIEIQRPLAERNPEVTAFQSNLADSFNELGQLEQQGDLAAAADDYRATLDIYTRLVAQHPDVARFQNGVAGAMVNLAVIDQLEGRYAEAALRLKAAGPFHRAALAAGPDDSSYRTYFRNNRSNLVQVELALGHHASAAANILEWARYARDAIDTYDAACSTALCISLAQKDEALSGTDRHRTVMGYASQAIELLEKAINAGFHDAEQIAKNHYLDSLRDHDGFKKLIDSMKEPKPWEDCGVPARNMKDLSRVAGGLRGGAFIAAQTDTAELWDVATLGPRFRL
jgi:tetratricopeptide (TPR) repeat protein